VLYKVVTCPWAPTGFSNNQPIIISNDSHFKKKTYILTFTVFKIYPRIFLEFFFPICLIIIISTTTTKNVLLSFQKISLTFFFLVLKKLSFILNNCINFTVDQPFKKNYTIHANLLSTPNLLPKLHEFLPNFLDVLKEQNIYPFIVFCFCFDLDYSGLKIAHKARPKETKVEIQTKHTHTHLTPTQHTQINLLEYFFFDSIFRFYFSWYFLVKWVYKIDYKINKIVVCFNTFVMLLEMKKKIPKLINI